MCFRNIELSESAMLMIADALESKAKKYEGAAGRTPSEFSKLARDARLLSDVFYTAFDKSKDSLVTVNVSIIPKDE